MPRKNLAQVLLNHNGITKENLKEISRLQREEGQTLYNALHTLCGEDEERRIAAIMCDLTDCPFINLCNYHIPEDLMLIIPIGIAKTLQVMPVSMISKVITIAMADPLNVSVQDWVKETSRASVAVMVSTATDINYAVENIGVEIHEEVVHLKESEKKAKASESVEDLLGRLSATVGSDKNMLSQGMGEEEVITLVDTMILSGVRQNSSDIHLEPYEGIFRLRYRHDGKLKVVSSPPIAMYSAICSRIKIMADLNIAEHRIPQDGRMKIKHGDREIDLRVSILPTHHGEKVVLRILDREGLSLDFNALGFSDAHKKDFQEAIEQPNGIVLVTGPTGSGKTTTLYSALSYLNKEDVNIVTLEDPVEYDLFAINQIQVHAKVGLTFASGLRSILRQDPDIIMVGEIRDGETAEIAIKSALTGHLVLSTLHTNDAVGAIYRLLDMNVQPFMLAASLNLCQAQRLVRKLCPKCKVPAKVPGNLLDDIKRVSEKENPEIFEAHGCPKCTGIGYKGRTSVIEIVPITPDVRDLISAGAPAGKVKKLAKEKGIPTLYEAAIKAVGEGITSIEEALRVTVA